MESTVWEELTAAPKSCSWGISSAATQAGLKMLHQWSVPSVCRQLQQHLGQLQRTRACSCSVLTATAQVGFHIPQCFHTYVQSFRFVLVGNTEPTSKKPNVCSAVYGKQVLHLGGTPAARAWRDQCLCTQSELRIVLISPDTAPEPVQNPAASPCSEHTALGNQNQHQAGVSSVTPCPGSPSFLLWASSAAVLLLPSCLRMGLLHAFLCNSRGWGENSRCSPSWGFWWCWLPPDPQQIFLSQFPGQKCFSTGWAQSWKAIEGRGWFNQGCLCQPHWHN